jgi:hypothetical protein
MWPLLRWSVWFSDDMRGGSFLRGGGGPPGPPRPPPPRPPSRPPPPPPSFPSLPFPLVSPLPHRRRHRWNVRPVARRPRARHALCQCCHATRRFWLLPRCHCPAQTWVHNLMSNFCGCFASSSPRVLVHNCKLARPLELRLLGVFSH